MGWLGICFKARAFSPLVRNAPSLSPLAGRGRGEGGSQWAQRSQSFSMAALDMPRVPLTRRAARADLYPLAGRGEPWRLQTRSERAHLQLTHQGMKR